MKLKPEIKKLWVDALRSGRYKQGYNDLADDNGGLCCLGVQAIELGCEILPANQEGDSYRRLCLPDGRVVEPEGTLPQELFPMIYDEPIPLDGSVNLRRWQNPEVQVNDEDGVIILSASQMNDEYAMEFAQIASIIEKQL